jgi:hypothetical protein
MPGRSSSLRIRPGLWLAGAKTHCTSGVADAGRTLTEAAQNEAPKVIMPLPLQKVAHDLVRETEPAGALVQGFEVPDIARHARDVVVLGILANAGQRMPYRDT